MIDAVARRTRRAYADLRRRLGRAGSARSALAAFGGGRRRHTADWRRITADQHEQYRRAHPPADGSVAVVCVTCRPHRLEALVANVVRQDLAALELVVVTNHAGYDEVDVAAATTDFGGRLTVLRRDPDQTLGHCLNDGLDATDARFVAKFDDDDLYGPAFLTDSLRAHRYAGAGIVGKHTYYAHLEESDETVLRFPGHEFTYSSTLAGGTLVIDRHRVGDLRFEDRSLGEDRAFIEACHRAGISTFSADRFNFTQVRGGDNEWWIGRERFIRRSEVIGGGWLRAEIER